MYMNQISTYTWIQLGNETQRLTNTKNTLVEIIQLLDQQWDLNREELSNLLLNLHTEADIQEDRISHMDYLANTTSAQFLVDHRNYFLIHRQCEEVESLLERLRRYFRHEKLQIQNQLTRMSLLASLVGLTSLLKTERGDPL